MKTKLENFVKRKASSTIEEGKCKGHQKRDRLLIFGGMLSYAWILMKKNEASTILDCLFNMYRCRYFRFKVLYNFSSYYNFYGLDSKVLWALLVLIHLMSI